MSKFYTKLNKTLETFITEQKMFFTASAPDQGRINLSPKGIDTFRIIDNKTVAYLDLTGSGNETSAHIKQNSRLTIMFCSFTDQPLILRLYGTGEIITPDNTRWAQLSEQLPERQGSRQFVVLNIKSVQTSCGFGVPQYQFLQDRHTLEAWARKKGAKQLKQYRHDKNRLSIDGLTTHIE